MNDKQREKSNAKTRAWRHANPDKIREYKKKHYLKYLERQRAKNRAYYAANRERKLRNEKARHFRNRDEILAKGRARRAKNPEKYRQMQREHKNRNPGMWRLYSVRTRCKRDGIIFDLDVQWFTDRLRAGVCEMSGIAFDLTGKRTPNSPSVDRKDPKGPYTKENCRLILWWLNRAMVDLGEDYAIGVFEAVIAQRIGIRQ